jgi:hypothetical protein
MKYTINRSKIATTLILTALLLLITYYIILSLNDAVMQLKHWFMLMLFEIVIQVIIEREFRNKN